MKHIQLLNKGFERDEHFYNQKKYFMDELIDKEYARKCKSAEPEGKTWYVPHQRV